MTAILQARALSYDAIKERPEKRLLKRLGWYWKLNDREVTAPRTVETWIRDDLGDTPTEYKRRDAERFEQALDRLKADGCIRDWQYTLGEERIAATEGSLPHRWLERWIERKIVIEAPESLRMAYLERQSKKKLKEQEKQRKLAFQAAESPNDDYGKRFRSFRIGLGISALQAAQESGVHNSALSRIETGKRPATDEQRKKLDAWMRELKNRPDLVAARHNQDKR
jgi:hypothetical protein